MIRLTQTPPNYKLEYFIGDEVVGFLEFSVVFESCDIINIEVLPPFRRKKIASSLFSYFLIYLKEKKVEQILLEVRKSNLPAIRLYERLGFVLLNERANYYQNPIEDALIYKLTLEL